MIARYADVNKKTRGSCASPGACDRTASRDTPPTTAGARAVCRCNSNIAYDIDLYSEKAQRLLTQLHRALGLYPTDRQLLIKCQYYLKNIKKTNNYEPNTALNLFPP